MRPTVTICFLSIFLLCQVNPAPAYSTAKTSTLGTYMFVPDEYQTIKNNIAAHHPDFSKRDFKLIVCDVDGTITKQAPLEEALKMWGYGPDTILEKCKVTVKRDRNDNLQHIKCIDLAGEPKVYGKGVKKLYDIVSRCLEDNILRVEEGKLINNVGTANLQFQEFYKEFVVTINAKWMLTKYEECVKPYIDPEVEDLLIEAMVVHGCTVLISTARAGTTFDDILLRSLWEKAQTFGVENSLHFAFENGMSCQNAFNEKSRDAEVYSVFKGVEYQLFETNDQKALIENFVENFPGLKHRVNYKTVEVEIVLSERNEEEFSEIISWLEAYRDAKDLPVVIEPGPKNIIVRDSRAGKDKVIDYFITTRGFRAADIITFGDAANDFPMLGYEGVFGVFVGLSYGQQLPKNILNVPQGKREQMGSASTDMVLRHMLDVKYEKVREEGDQEAILDVVRQKLTYLVINELKDERDYRIKERLIEKQCEQIEEIIQSLRENGFVYLDLGVDRSLHESVLFCEDKCTVDTLYDACVNNEITRIYRSDTVSPQKRLETFVGVLEKAQKDYERSDITDDHRKAIEAFFVAGFGILSGVDMERYEMSFDKVYKIAMAIWDYDFQYMDVHYVRDSILQALNAIVAEESKRVVQFAVNGDREAYFVGSEVFPKKLNDAIVDEITQYLAGRIVYRAAYFGVTSYAVETGSSTSVKTIEGNIRKIIAEESAVEVGDRSGYISVHLNGKKLQIARSMIIHRNKAMYEKITTTYKAFVKERPYLKDGGPSEIEAVEGREGNDFPYATRRIGDWPDGSPELKQAEENKVKDKHYQESFKDWIDTFNQYGYDFFLTFKCPLCFMADTPLMKGGRFGYLFETGHRFIVPISLKVQYSSQHFMIMPLDHIHGKTVHEKMLDYLLLGTRIFSEVEAYSEYQKRLIDMKPVSTIRNGFLNTSGFGASHPDHIHSHLMLLEFPCFSSDARRTVVDDGRENGVQISYLTDLPANNVIFSAKRDGNFQKLAAVTYAYIDMLQQKGFGINLAFRDNEFVVFARTIENVFTKEPLRVFPGKGGEDELKTLKIAGLECTGYFMRYRDELTRYDTEMANNIISETVESFDEIAQRFDVPREQTTLLKIQSIVGKALYGALDDCDASVGFKMAA